MLFLVAGLACAGSLPRAAADPRYDDHERAAECAASVRDECGSYCVYPNCELCSRCCTRRECVEWAPDPTPENPEQMMCVKDKCVSWTDCAPCRSWQWYVRGPGGPRESVNMDFDFRLPNTEVVLEFGEELPEGNCYSDDGTVVSQESVPVALDQGERWVAQEFVTGGNPRGYELSRVVLNMVAYGNLDSSLLVRRWRSVELSGSDPQVGLSLAGEYRRPGRASFPVSSRLQPNTRYYLVLRTELPEADDRIPLPVPGREEDAARGGVDERPLYAERFDFVPGPQGGGWFVEPHSFYLDSGTGDWTPQPVVLATEFWGRPAGMTEEELEEDAPPEGRFRWDLELLGYVRTPGATAARVRTADFGDIVVDPGPGADFSWRTHLGGADLRGIGLVESVGLDGVTFDRLDPDLGTRVPEGLEPVLGNPGSARLVHALKLDEQRYELKFEQPPDEEMALFWRAWDYTGLGASPYPSQVRFRYLEPGEFEEKDVALVRLPDYRRSTWAFQLACFNPDTFMFERYSNGVLQFVGH